MVWMVIKIFLETLFFLGMAGSLVVVCLILIEDVGIFKKGEDEKVKQGSERPVREDSQLQQPGNLSEHLRRPRIL
jgi:hypothetical protein